jgi:hypothetical protein
VRVSLKKTVRVVSRCALNHFERDGCLVTKHGLYWSLRALFEGRSEPLPQWLPETYHIIPESNASDASSDPKKQAEWPRWLAAFQREANALQTHPKAAEDAAAGADGDEVAAGAEKENPDKLPPIGRAQCVLAEGAVAAPAAPKLFTARRKKSSGGAGAAVANVWIAKPAALSNRGAGIHVVSSPDQVGQGWATAVGREDPDLRKSGHVNLKPTEPKIVRWC